MYDLQMAIDKIEWSYAGDDTDIEWLPFETAGVIK